MPPESIDIPRLLAVLAGLAAWFGLVLIVNHSAKARHERASYWNTLTVLTGPFGALLYLLYITDAPRARKLASSTQLQLLCDDGEPLTKGRSAAAPVQVVESVMQQAIEADATDCHLQLVGDGLVARFRIDGVLEDVHEFSADLHRPVLSIIKNLARLDITERRRPQDGSFRGQIAGRTIAFRVSTSPAEGGEKVAIRILGRSQSAPSLDRLGLSPATQSELRKFAAGPDGLLLACGPTGSGKTTTLYALLQTVDVSKRNIITIEDPIEYALAGATQVEVRPRQGLTFANALRSMLRQDPDVVMVGEIRDSETAQIAHRATLAGQLVFSTVHASDAVGALFRLLDLQVKPAELVSSSVCFLSQRLVRRICAACRMKCEPTLDPAEVQPSHVYRANPKGCEACRGRGYRGRIGIFELLTLTDTIRDRLRTEQPSIEDVREGARAQGFVSMLEDGHQKLLSGITDEPELQRVVRGES